MTLHALREQAQHLDTAVRRAAVLDLGHYDAPEAIATLVACLQDPSRAVVDAAVHSLLRIGTEAVALALIPLLTHEQIAQRSLALDGLTGLGRRAGPAMVALLSNPDREQRKSACEVLTDSGYTESGPALAGCIADADPVVRAAVAAAIAGLGYRAALPGLIEQWQVEQEEWPQFALASAICHLATTEQVAALLAQTGPGPVREMIEADLALRTNGGE